MVSATTGAPIKATGEPARARSAGFGTGSVRSGVMRGDVVVIGSGPIAAVVARRFAEAGRAVIMLEAGPAISDPPGCHVRNQARFQRDPDSFLEGIADRFTYFDEAAAPAGLPGACTTAAVGGQGVLWTNNCPRPAPFERWAAMPAPDWDYYLSEAEAPDSGPVHQG